MPAKKGKAATPTPVVQENETQTNMAPPQDDVNQRLARIEAAIERMSTQPPVRVPSPTIMTTRGRAKKTGQTVGNNDRRSVSLDPTTSRRRQNVSQSTSSVNASIQSTQRPDVNKDAASDVTPTTCDLTAHTTALADPVVLQPGDPFIGVNKPQAPRQLFDVNTAQPWSNWTSATNSNFAVNTDFSAPPPHPTQYGFEQDDVEKRVQDILASTASTLS